MAKRKSPTITYTTEAVKRINENTNGDGTLERDVRVAVECVRTVWVVDAKDRVGRDDVTLPKGYGMDAISDMLAFVVEVRCEESRRQGWRMPPLSTAYLCDDGRIRTVGQMLEGISIELMPHDEVDFETLMDCFGCDWTHPLSPLMHPHGLLA